jgi:hypothetical protein
MKSWLDYYAEVWEARTSVHNRNAGRPFFPSIVATAMYTKQLLTGREAVLPLPYRAYIERDKDDSEGDTR